MNIVGVGMNIFNIENLNRYSNTLVQDIERDHLTIITKEGSPISIAIPFTEEMLKLGIPKMLAIKMLEGKTLTVPQAAKIAGWCLIDMFSLASSQGVDVVDYDPKEIDDELAAYYG